MWIGSEFRLRLDSALYIGSQSQCFDTESQRNQWIDTRKQGFKTLQEWVKTVPSIFHESTHIPTQLVRNSSFFFPFYPTSNPLMEMQADESVYI